MSGLIDRVAAFWQFKYDQEKQTQRAKQHRQQMKEIRLRPKTGEHDIEFKLKQARTFLGDGDKVKVTVFFRGCETAHHERGREVLQQVMTALEDVAKAEALPRIDSGRSMSCIMTPK